MFRKTAYGMILGATLLAGSQGVAAQAPGNTTLCTFPWCVNYVAIALDASGNPVATPEWNEIRMLNKLAGATVLWILVGHPDYEFRANSVVMTGANAAGSAPQFPLREASSNRYALDDVNTTNLPYTYQVRVYKKGSPPDSTPIVVNGTIVNASN